MHKIRCNLVPPSPCPSAHPPRLPLHCRLPMLCTSSPPARRIPGRTWHHHHGSAVGKQAGIHLRTCTGTHVPTHMHIHIHILWYTHTHTHTQMQQQQRQQRTGHGDGHPHRSRHTKREICKNHKGKRMTGRGCRPGGWPGVVGGELHVIGPRAAGGLDPTLVDTSHYINPHRSRREEKKESREDLGKERGA